MPLPITDTTDKLADRVPARKKGIKNIFPFPTGDI